VIGKAQNESVFRKYSQHKSLKQVTRLNKINII
jgi:hypothetical protein